MYARGSAFRTKSEGATESHARGPSCTGRAVEDVSIGAGPRRARERPSCSGPRSSAGPVPPRARAAPRAHPLKIASTMWCVFRPWCNTTCRLNRPANSRPPELLRQLRRERPQRLQRHVRTPHQVRAPAQIDRRGRQHVVHRQRAVPEPPDSSLIAERLNECLPEADAHVLNSVVGVDVRVALARHGEVEEAVPGDVREHVVEEPHAVASFDTRCRRGSATGRSRFRSSGARYGRCAASQDVPQCREQRVDLAVGAHGDAEAVVGPGVRTRRAGRVAHVADQNLPRLERLVNRLQRAIGTAGTTRSSRGSA